MNRGVGMLEEGASQRHMARQLGVSQSVVARMWSCYQMMLSPDTGEVVRGLLRKHKTVLSWYKPDVIAL
ncbi:hypothetical protein DPMN_051917 [Dreissena polymorpha]|uniref:Uncharacterized protein n=1 Tax=Dreissena polymorpha TaxID=45954 RepID=A0A9D4CJG1_DREPO|nr:hypothetical protein DPMN_051917 [Dreissena polymorpha]